jgi:hypothetical protein
VKTIRFTYPHPTGGYGCSEPGDNSGEYVPAAVAGELVAALTEALDDGDHGPECGVHGWVPTDTPPIVRQGPCDCWVTRARAAVAKATGG